MTILLLLVGLGLIVLGADWLVDGASAIARKAGVSEFVIGLTIVGFGTSCPELVVSLTGAIGGNADISILKIPTILYLWSGFLRKGATVRGLAEPAVRSSVPLLYRRI